MGDEDDGELLPDRQLLEQHDEAARVAPVVFLAAEQVDQRVEDDEARPAPFDEPDEGVPERRGGDSPELRRGGGDREEGLLHLAPSKRDPSRARSRAIGGYGGRRERIVEDRRAKCFQRLANNRRNHRGTVEATVEANEINDFQRPSRTVEAPSRAHDGSSSRSLRTIFSVSAEGGP
jgi:hypothetical protein